MDAEELFVTKGFDKISTNDILDWVLGMPQGSMREVIMPIFGE